MKQLSVDLDLVARILDDHGNRELEIRSLSHVHVHSLSFLQIQERQFYS